MVRQKKHYSLLRQWKMLQLLPSRSAKDAASIRDELEREGFEVDLRTVQRDLKELMEIFPLAPKAGKPISWCWDSQAMSFDIPGMDKTTALTLKMVDDFMTRLLPKSCMDSLEPNLKRANAILSDVKDSQYTDWPQKVKIVSRSQPLLPPDIDGDVLELIYDCLFTNQRFKANYLKKGEKKTTEYVVNPLGIVISDPVVYLVATLWDYDNVKLFAMHRFKSAEHLYEAANKPEGFSLDGYLQTGALSFAAPNSEKLRLKALFNPYAVAHLYESPLSHEQKLTKQDDGRVLIDVEILDTQQLRWWLLSFGDNVEVIEPLSLREEFAEIARNLAGCYQETKS